VVVGELDALAPFALELVSRLIRRLPLLLVVVPLPLVFLLRTAFRKSVGRALWDALGRGVPHHNGKLMSSLFGGSYELATAT